MALKFGPDDEAEFEAARDRLARGFEASGAGAGLGWVAEQVLLFKWAYLDGDLASWSDEDLRTILFELYPAKVGLDADDHDEVLRGFAGLLRYLGLEGLMEGAAAERLARRVEASAVAFASAMADDSRFGMGKRLLGAMAEEGFDPSDPASIDAWMASFNDRPFEERDRILGPAMVPPSASQFSATLPGRLPPVVLAPEAELRAAALVAPLFRQVRGLVAFVGEGRKLTDRGNLTLSDAKKLVALLGTADRVDEQIGDKIFRTRSSTELPQLDLAFRVAVGAGMLRAEGRSVRPGRYADLLERDPLEAVNRLFFALLERVGPTAHHYGGDHYGWGWYAEDLDRDLLRVLVDLYRGSGPAEIDELGDECWEELLDIYDLDHVEADKREFHHELVKDALRRALHRLEEIGVVVLHDIQQLRTEYGTVKESGGTVGLSPLGVWILHRFLSKATDAPVAGALSELEASELLARAVDLADDVASLEVDTWVDRHGDAAPALLVDALSRAGEAGRALALRALLRIGPPAAQALAQLADDREFAPYVTVWRVDTLVAAKEEMDAGGDPDRFVRLLHAVFDLRGPHAVSAWLAPAAGTEGVEAMLDRSWRIRLPETETVLSTIGQFYPDKTIAKSARKALFRYRSSGGTTTS